MLNFQTFGALKSYIQALPGYIPSFRQLDSWDETIGGIRWDCSTWTFKQLPLEQTLYRNRECLVRVPRNPVGAQDGDYILDMPLLSETPEGINKIVTTFGGPDTLYPWVFSVWGHIPRDGAGLSKFRLDGTPAQEGDLDTDLWFKQTMTQTLGYEIGFQNIIACWARMNEGDYCDVFVDIPGAWVGYPEVPWVTFAQFGENITMFGTNAKGTAYPPNQSPSVSWVPAGARLRFEIYKKVIDDPEFALGEGQTETTNPEKRGPFFDLDILCQRKR